MKTTAPPPVRETVAAPAPPAPAPQLIERLQRSAGNRAVTAFLQRQPVATKEHLSAGQAAHAVAFYTGRPELYPSDVILEDPEGRRVAPDRRRGHGDGPGGRHLAVPAEPQARRHGRPADAAADVRERPGGQEVARGGRRRRPRASRSDWKDLKTAEARAAKLYEGVKAQLEAAGVKPPPKHEGQGPREGRRPVRRPRTGRSTSTTTRSPRPISTTTRARDVAGTVYHEARHAEQGYKMARMLAAKGNDARADRRQDGPPDRRRDRARTTTRCRRASSSPPPRSSSTPSTGRARRSTSKAEREAVSSAELRAAKQAVDDEPDAGEQGAPSAAERRLPRPTTTSHRERRVRHRDLLRGELGRGPSLKSPAARVVRRSQARVGHALARVRACH